MSGIVPETVPPNGELLAGEQQEVGFFEEAHNTRSMTRLIIFELGLQSALVVVTTCIYVLAPLLGGEKPDSAIVLALAAVVGALVAQGIVAIIQRGG